MSRSRGYEEAKRPRACAGDSEPWGVCSISRSIAGNIFAAFEARLWFASSVWSHGGGERGKP